ncbi:MAG: nuclear transport factor 2 family protein [Tolypothrix sp. T3-bin4]|nr:nuclear transport factor 2 family protein [Tolypothrix sp. T3-bin4]
MTSQPSNPTLLHTQLPDALFAQYTTESTYKLAAADKLEITEKLYLLELIFDTRRYEIMDAILTEDFVMDHALAKRLDRASFKQLWQDNEAALLNGIRHQLTNVIVYADNDDTATAIAYLNVLKFTNTSTLSKTNNPVLLAHAVQVVQFRKEKDVWKLAHLTIDQMAVSDIFGLDQATGDYFAALANERDQLRQPLF